MTRSGTKIFDFVPSRIQRRFLVMISVLFVKIVYIIMINDHLIIQKSTGNFFNLLALKYS